MRYKGVKPDMFQTGVDVIVEGRIGHDGVLAASVLMTSCPSKYQEEKALRCKLGWHIFRYMGRKEEL